MSNNGDKRDNILFHNIIDHHGIKISLSRCFSGNFVEIGKNEQIIAIYHRMTQKKFE